MLRYMAGHSHNTACIRLGTGPALSRPAQAYGGMRVSSVCHNAGSHASTDPGYILPATHIGQIKKEQPSCSTRCSSATRQKAEDARSTPMCCSVYEKRAEMAPQMTGCTTSRSTSSSQVCVRAVTTLRSPMHNYQQPNASSADQTCLVEARSWHVCTCPRSSSSPGAVTMDLLCGVLLHAHCVSCSFPTCIRRLTSAAGMLRLLQPPSLC